ncbi:MAG: pyruvate kinase [Chloroflexi bacterium]|nr:pyruvate kinase [Chloroflexota bacterium]MBA3851369.1 pyruvate kinase [Chloroflexota bacterium]MDQ3406976.1 pyruvate kinase [Chloroflexota bacterium]
MPHTKLVCTLGPASAERIPALIEAGMSVARLNFSHGTEADHRRTATAVRQAAATVGWPVALMADLPGPKVRLGDLVRGSITLRDGARLLIRGHDAPGDETVVSTSHPALGSDLEVGDRVLLADGAVELRVLAAGDLLETEVVRGGTVRSGAGVNIPSERLTLPAITERDRRALEVALSIGVDLVAQSFVRRAQDLSSLRTLLGRHRVGVVAKLETRAAVEDLAAILEGADAVMVARGDLGVEIPYEEIPLVQKRIVAAALAVGRPVIVATQMLESMTAHSRPTRAEASDVTTAVLEGADAVMLSAETAIGRHPIEAAKAAMRICGFAEANGAAYETRLERSRPFPPPVVADRRPVHGGGLPTEEEAEQRAAWAIASAAADLADRDPHIGALACYTTSGRTAALLSAARPHKAILALSADPVVLRRLALYRGVVAGAAEQPADTDAVVALIDRVARESLGLGTGASVVIVAGSPVGRALTNVLRVHRLG